MNRQYESQFIELNVIHPWVDNWLMAIFPLSSWVESCIVSPEVWLSIKHPSFEESDIFKINDDNDDDDDDDDDDDWMSNSTINVLLKIF